MDHRSFLPWVLPLSRDHVVILYDQRGSGRSAGVDPDTCRLETLVEDLEVLRLALGVHKPVLVGHSAGGMVALLYALRFPEQVHRIALIGSVGTHRFIGLGRELLAQRATPLQLDAYDRLWSDRIRDDEDYRTAWTRLLPLYFADQSRATPTPEDLPFSVQVRRSVGRDVRLFDLTGRLHEIEVPVLVMAGARDWLCPLEEARAVADGVVRGQLAVFPSSGHFPFIEETDSFLTTMRDFIGRPDTGGA